MGGYPQPEIARKDAEALTSIFADSPYFSLRPTTRIRPGKKDNAELKRFRAVLVAATLCGMLSVMSQVTRILAAVESGDPKAAAQLLPLVYDELRKLAAGHMANEAQGHTLDATALVHEAYLRLVGEQRFENRRHFFAAAAEAMRRILVDRARERKSLKRGGDRKRLRFDQLHLEAEQTPAEFLALHEALDRLEAKDQRKADLVKLRFFAGLTNEQAAEALGISTSTADNDWAYARAWLRLALQESSADYAD